MGVTREEREKMFDKFQRGQEGIEMDPNGTGLGLYIVKRTLEVLHGSIDVHSEGRGKGATFSVTLPK
jgi:signal transduction histidine kinase